MSRIAAIQISSSTDIEVNLSKVKDCAQKAVLEGAEMIVLPENVAFMGIKESDKLAIQEKPGFGPIQSFFSTLAKELNILLVGGTIPIQSEDKTRPFAAC